MHQHNRISSPYVLKHADRQKHKYIAKVGEGKDAKYFYSKEAYNHYLEAQKFLAKDKSLKVERKTKGNTVFESIYRPGKIIPSKVGSKPTQKENEYIRSYEYNTKEKQKRQEPSTRITRAIEIGKKKSTKSS